MMEKVEASVEPNTKVFERLWLAFEFEVCRTLRETASVIGNVAREFEVDEVVGMEFIVTMEEFVVGLVVVNVEPVEIRIPLNEEDGELHGALLDHIDVLCVAIEVSIVDHYVVAVDEDLDAFDGVDGAGIVEVDGVEYCAETTALWTAANICLPGRYDATYLDSSTSSV